MKTLTAYETEDHTIQHYGVAGMRWGVRKQYDVLGGNRTGSKKTDSKPKSSTPQRSPAQMKAARQESMRAEIETLRSMGNSAMANKLQKDYDDLYGSEKARSDAEQAASEHESWLAGEPDKTEEEEKEKEGKKGKGKAAAAPKAPPPPKKDDSRSKAQKARELAKSQREVAKTFRQEAIAIKQEIAKMEATSNAIRSRMGGFQKDLAVAQKNGDRGAVKTLQGLIDRLKGRITDNQVAIKAQTPIAERFDAKASEWEALADETLSSLKEDKKVKHSGGKLYISHYGIPGMRWGVRRTAEQLGRTPRSAQRRASKEARSLSDEELRSKIARMQLEKQYSDLVKQETERDRSALSEGAQKVGENIVRSGSQSIGNVAGDVVAYGMIEGLNKYTGLNLKNKKRAGD